MSRIGKKNILVPDKVEVKLEGNIFKVKGPKGELTQEIHPRVKINIDDKSMHVTVKDENLKSDRALWGLFASLIINMVHGVTEGFEKKLEVNGIGFKVNAVKNTLKLNLGFSHEVIFEVPADLTVLVEKNVITISGINKQRVGEITAQIRSLKKPEPYKGKGIKYIDEVIRRKAGKTAGKAD